MIINNDNDVNGQYHVWACELVHMLALIIVIMIIK